MRYTAGALIFDLGGPSHYSGNYLIGFEHCGAHFFDLEGPSHNSGNYLVHVDVGFGHSTQVSDGRRVRELNSVEIQTR